MSGGWGCPHEQQGQCLRVRGKPCRLGMPGCVLRGRFNFADPADAPPPLPSAPAGKNRESND